MLRRAKYYVQNLQVDAPASVVVVLVAIPLCLGIAMGSNAPLFSGLIAGMVGGILIGVLSGSHLSVSGPAAGLTAIVVVALGKLPSFESFLLSVSICGILQIILGYVRAGILGDYVPNGVIKGMLAAIGLILILKQVPHLVGYDKNFEGDENFMQEDQHNTFSALARALRSITPIAFLIGGVSLLFQYGWDKVVGKRKGVIKLIPAPLMVVLIGVLINEAFKQNASEFAIGKDHMVNIPIAATVTEFFSFFNFPDWNQLWNKDVWITGITLALVASLETLLSIEAIDNLDPYQRVTNKDRELKAQGIGNIVSGLIGGLPVTSVIVRSSANVNAGARTKMATIFHGILLLVCIAFLPQLLNHIPKAALAAILIYTGYKLAKPSLFKSFYRKGWEQFLPFAITVAAVLLTDLLMGVVIGIVTGLFFVIRSNFRTAVFMVHSDDKYLFRLRKDVSFLNKPILKNKLEQVPENAHVFVDTSRADFIDKDVVEVIENFMKHASLKNIRVVLKTHIQRNQGFKQQMSETAKMD
jgi:MFS superfamily sulfate permease-like transporter